MLAQLQNTYILGTTSYSWLLQDDELAAIPQRISQFQESVNQLQGKLSLLKNLQPLWLRYRSSCCVVEQHYVNPRMLSSSELLRVLWGVFEEAGHPKHTLSCGYKQVLTCAVSAVTVCHTLAAAASHKHCLVYASCCWFLSAARCALSCSLGFVCSCTSIALAQCVFQYTGAFVSKLDSAEASACLKLCSHQQSGSCHKILTGRNWQC